MFQNFIYLYILVLFQIRHLNDLVKNDTVSKVFKETEDITPEIKHANIIESLSNRYCYCHRISSEAYLL